MQKCMQILHCLLTPVYAEISKKIHVEIGRGNILALATNCVGWEKTFNKTTNKGVLLKLEEGDGDSIHKQTHTKKMLCLLSA